VIVGGCEQCCWYCGIDAVSGIVVWLLCWWCCVVDLARHCSIVITIVIIDVLCIDDYSVTLMMWYSLWHCDVLFCWCCCCVCGNKWCCVYSLLCHYCCVDDWDCVMVLLMLLGYCYWVGIVLLCDIVMLLILIDHCCCYCWCDIVDDVLVFCWCILTILMLCIDHCIIVVIIVSYLVLIYYYYWYLMWLLSIIVLLLN